MPIKLNLGCGKKHKEGYVNIDIQEPCDLKHDLRNPLPFADDSIDEVFSEGNFVCHVSRADWRGLKREIARTLKPDGKLEIIFLDFEYLAKSFLENKDDKRWGWWWMGVFGGQEDDYDFSKNCFTCDKLISDFQEEGMVDFKTERLSQEGYVRLICSKQRPDRTMKILIGTPINIRKDYAMEQWLENVSKLEYPADLILVDSSPGLDYIEKVKGYCTKYGINNYKIKHIEISQFQPWAEKAGRSWEIIRQEVLASDYDAWFSWECDRTIPIDALDKLVTIMKAGNYMMLHPNSWKREIPTQPAADFGCSLIKRECLEKYGFLLEGPDMPDCWARSEDWFKKRVLKDGGNYIELYGIIDPICHLNNTNKK